jgi:hypothetical protein
MLNVGSITLAWMMNSLNLIQRLKSRRRLTSIMKRTSMVPLFVDDLTPPACWLSPFVAGSSAAARMFASSRRLSLAVRCPWLGTELGGCVVILIVLVRVGIRRLICHVFCRSIIPFSIRLSGRRSRLSPAYNFPVHVLIVIIIIVLAMSLFLL